ncbi:MAG TPA: hypothetical protein VIJ22_14175 [Polyangiaceae bacterium]
MLSLVLGWVLVGCGGSVSSPGSQQGSPDASTSVDAAVDRGSPDDASQGEDAEVRNDGPDLDAGTSATGPVQCSALLCEAGVDCCLDFAGSTPVSCVAPGASCSGLRLECSGSASCPSGQVCCGPGSTTGTATCKPACGIGELEVCWDQATTCPSGTCCQQRFDVRYCIADDSGC